MRLGSTLMSAFAALVLLCATSAYAQGPRPCPTVLQRLARAGPKYAEVYAAARAVAKSLPRLHSTRYNFNAPLNWVVNQHFGKLQVPVKFAKSPDAVWSPAQMRRVVNTLSRLTVPKFPNDKSCPSITPITTVKYLRMVLIYNTTGRAQAPSDSGVISAAANGAWGPIYIPSSTNNNTGAIGTGYNILLAGPNAFSGSLSGVDPGLLFVPIFSTNLGFTPGDPDSYQCSNAASVTFSAEATQKNTSTSLGAKATYNGVTGAANTQFGSSMAKQSGSSSSATMFSCNAAAFSFNLKSFAIMDSSALDTSFYASAVGLIQAGIATNFDMNNPALSRQLASFVAGYGTHYLNKGYSGGTSSQACFMSTYTYTYAVQNGWSFSANLAAGANSVSGSSSSSTGTTSQFSNSNTQCSYIQSPGSVPMVVSSDGQPNIAQWMANLMSAKILTPSSYTLGAISDLFGYPNLFNNAYNSTVLDSMGQTLQAYIIACAPSNSEGMGTCGSFSPSCASQTYASGSQCLSCYTTGPRCSGLSVGGASFSGCSASTCYCNPPWQGNTCSTANVGTCYAAKKGIHNCNTYKNCCAPGWSTYAAQSKNTGQCGCQCKPPTGGGNGFTQQGCGTSFGQFCGQCRGCTNSQNSPYVCTGGR